jgi:hypothetical protein
MSVASAVDYKEIGAILKPEVISAIPYFNVASGTPVIVFNTVLPVGNWLVCGSVESNASDIITSFGISAGNGSSATKYILSGAEGVAFDGDINLAFSYCFFSNGSNPNDLTYTAVVANGGTFNVIESPTIQIVRVG